jgi:hypothetical protein
MSHVKARRITYDVCVKLTPLGWLFIETVTVRSASLEIPRLLWNPNVHSLCSQEPATEPVLSQMNPSEIWGFHGGEDADCGPLGRDSWTGLNTQIDGRAYICNLPVKRLLHEFCANKL